MTTDQRLPRARRVRASDEVLRTLRSGRRRRLQFLDVIWQDNSAGYPRLGLIVPRFQSSAVARNRLRRRLREIWRRDMQARLPAWDLVIRARREAYEATFGALRGDLLEWCDGLTG